MKRLARHLPVLEWLPHYRRADASADLLAGAVVAILIVPQAMAYALLAGLPPQVGLYASILPLALYALLGTSRALAVGPVAMVSLLVASGLSGLAAPGSGEAVALALALALLVGALQLAMGLARLGFLTSLLSHPVLSGFTSAAALVIAASQLPHVLGVALPRTPHFHETVAGLARALPRADPRTLAIGLGSAAVLLSLPRLAHRLPVRRGLREPLAKAGPLVVVAAGTLAVVLARWSGTGGIGVVGEIPRGLPRPTLPALDLARVRALGSTALVIALVGFMESIAVAKALASRRREHVDPDQELVALGAANLGAAFTGGFPVTGGFSRSVVNFDSGARTGMASLFTAALVALTLVALTPLLRDLPKAALAAIVVVAVARLVDLRALREIWRASRGEAATLLATFVGVLALGVERGLLIGAAAALGLHLARTYRPHLAVVGRVPGTEHYRNVRRHEVQTDPRVLAVRIDESLFFLNAGGLEERLLRLVHERPEARELVLIASAVNSIDTTALEALEALAHGLAEAGVRLHLAEVKGPVLDRLARAGFVERFGRDRIHLSTHGAMCALGAPSPAADRARAGDPSPDPCLAIPRR